MNSFGQSYYCRCKTGNCMFGIKDIIHCLYSPIKVFYTDIIGELVSDKIRRHIYSYFYHMYIWGLGHQKQVSQAGMSKSLQWCYIGPHHCLINCLFRSRSKKTSKLCITGLCAGNSPVTGEFPAQRASNVENVSIWWCHHVHPTVFCGIQLFIPVWDNCF